MHLIGVYCTDVHLIGVYLMGVHLIGVHLMGMYFTGMYLMSVHFRGVSHGRVPHGACILLGAYLMERASHGRVS